MFGLPGGVGGEWSACDLLSEAILLSGLDVGATTAMLALLGAAIIQNQLLKTFYRVQKNRLHLPRH